MAEVDWPDETLEQLNRIADYIEVFNPVSAVQTADRLLALGNSLATSPNRGRPTGRGTRELVTVPPYVLRYRVDGDVVTILSIRHSARRPLA